MGKVEKGGAPRRRNARRQRHHNWSASVTRGSDALDLEPKVFAKPRATEIAQSLKHSAEHSTRRKSTPFRSATFYINRAGANLPKSRLKVLERAKHELRRIFGRE
jgi:hypothetical protein